MFKFIKQLFTREVIDYADLLAKGAVIIDVRNPGEFSGGHVQGSVNIPFGEIRNEIPKLKKEGKPVIACCLSGVRSGRAVGLLKDTGIEAYNGGGWKKVNDDMKAQ